MAQFAIPDAPRSDKPFGKKPRASPCGTSASAYLVGDAAEPMPLRLAAAAVDGRQAAAQALPRFPVRNFTARAQGGRAQSATGPAVGMMSGTCSKASAKARRSSPEGRNSLRRLHGRQERESASPAGGRPCGAVCGPVAVLPSPGNRSRRSMSGARSTASRKRSRQRQAAPGSTPHRAAAFTVSSFARASPMDEQRPCRPDIGVPATAPKARPSPFLQRPALCRRQSRRNDAASCRESADSASVRCFPLDSPTRDNRSRSRACFAVSLAHRSRAGANRAEEIPAP